MAQVGARRTSSLFHFSAKNVISVTAALYIDLDHLKNKRRRNHMHFKEIGEKENERERDESS